MQLLEHFNIFEYSLFHFFWLKVFGHTISLELHVIVNLLFAQEKSNPKLAAIGKHKIAWVIIICCICVASGFTSRVYWGTSVFKPNSLRYIEISVDPEDLNCSHNSFSLEKNQVCVPDKQCARKYRRLQLEVCSPNPQRLGIFFKILLLLEHHQNISGAIFCYF